jgi:mannose-6-phosphate isomerase-like protein (cupin superfamily)
MSALFTDRLAQTQRHALLGGVAISRLRVYEGRAPDGLAGGSPHLHLACTEAYFVLAGKGSVELVSLSDGYQRLRLEPGDGVQFEPGVVHRLVNDEDLEILVFMQNAGLPENGDAVFTFPREDLATRETYRQCASIDSLAGALARRDRAVSGLTALKDGFARSPEEGRDLLRALHESAAALVQPSVAAWLDIVEQGPAAAVAETRERLRELAAGRSADLTGARISRVLESDERLGICGRLNPFAIEGIRAGS